MFNNSWRTNTVDQEVFGINTIPTCNICGGDDFADLRGVPGHRCKNCGSLSRHRTAYETYTRCGMFKHHDEGCRVLHIAPEACLRTRLAKQLGMGYLPADAQPEAYKKIKVLRLMLPDGLEFFPDEYFDFIIHNHVLEHVPGPYQDTFHAQIRTLKVGGKLIFSVPGPKMRQLTIEGGEFMESDEERKAVFGQINHLKLFGFDMVDFLKELAGGQFYFDGITPEERAKISVGPNSARVLVWEKTSATQSEEFVVPEKFAAGAARSHLAGRSN